MKKKHRTIFLERDRPYPRLFNEFELADKPLRNRIVHASMSLGMTVGGKVSAGQIQYCANRAKGGAAMVITEPLGMIRQHMANLHRASAFTAADEDGLTRWARAVEGEGCRLLGQVQDSGRGRHLPYRNYTAIGAAPLPDDISWTMPHVLTTEEIATMLDDFGASSARLKRCGWSGVEISAGHGHIFHQFMSPWSNNRTDRYGGDFDGRMRLVIELIASLRAHCGKDFIVGMKIPGDDGLPGGIGPELAARIAARLTESGKVDYVCFAQGMHSRTLELHIPDGNTPRLTYMSMIGKLGRATHGVPVVALGRITDPAEAEGILARGDAQLVGVGRALITDPAWPLKAQQGRARDIRYCVSGNTCWFNAINGRPLVCDNNPRVAMADEVDFQPERVPTKRRLTVVGAGIAGMEAAWIAAARGLDVTVLGRSMEVGGKTRLHALLPGGEGMSSIYDYQHQEAIDSERVTFRLGIDAGLKEVLETEPDEVVLATGSTMIWPRCLPEALRATGLVPDLREAAFELLRHRARQPGTAVVFDMDHTEGTYAVIELLHALFERVVVLTPRASIAEDVPLVTRQGIVRRFHEKGIRVIPFSEPAWTDAMESGRLEVRHVYGGDFEPIEEVAFFSYSTPRAPNDALAEPLRAAGMPFRRVGDCVVAHAAQHATSTGHAAGLAVQA